MCQICLITEDNQFGQWLAAELPKDIECSISHDTDFNSQGAEQFNILIIDAASYSQPPSEFLEYLPRKKMDQTVIGLVSDRNSFLQGVSLVNGMDEIFERPPGRSGIYQIKNALANKITILARLADLQKKLRNELRRSQIVAKSPAMRAIMHRLPQLAESIATVLITGETGTGKELIARAIHYLGPRAAGPFVTVDCGAIPEHLVENELFGHIRGAYTDSGPSSKGLIEEADGGTLFLDEVEALPLGMQSKFLRFLQERQFKPLGHSKYIAVDVRVVAATNTDLSQAIKKNLFRQDLYYRLNVLPLFIPSLRQRKEDIPFLVDHFIQLHAGKDHDCDTVPAEILQGWIENPWPGNIRELENTVQQWLMTCGTELDSAPKFPETGTVMPIRSLAEIREIALAQCEASYFKQLMAYTKGNISLAAQLARIDRKSLGLLLKKRGIDVNQFRSY